MNRNWASVEPKELVKFWEKDNFNNIALQREIEPG